jgi:hypothetical protein
VIDALQEQFFRRLLRGQGQQPLRIVTDRLRSYSFYANVDVRRYAAICVDCHRTCRRTENVSESLRSLPLQRRVNSFVITGAQTDEDRPRRSVDERSMDLASGPQAMQHCVELVAQLDQLRKG